MKRIGFVLVITGLISPIWAGWRVEEIATFDQNIIAMTIGKGRNDDTNRIYCWADNTVEEITYADGIWYTIPICSLPSFGGFISTKGGMTLANGRNDGMMRLYAVSDSNLWEFTFSGGEWKGISFSVVDHSVYLTGLIAGPARNDDTIRLYSGIPEIGTIELTWRDNKWEVAGEIYDYYSGLPTAIGKGRNDGITRLYCSYGHRANSNTIMTEWRYVDEQWVKESSIEGDSIRNWIMGDGRNDSLMRIYGVYLHIVDPEYYHVREFTYSEGKWKLELLDDNFGGYVAAIGDGKHQGKNFVFVSTSVGLYAYEWKNRFWERDTVLPDTFSTSLSKNFLSGNVNNIHGPLVIGKARNDDTTRMYYAPKMGKSLLEITYEPEGIAEGDYSSNRGIWGISLYPNPFTQEIKIEWQGAAMGKPFNLEIYNAIGRKVKSFPQGVKTHSIVWDGKDNKGNLLPSGIYFCKFQAGGKSFMKKVVLKR